MSKTTLRLMLLASLIVAACPTATWVVRAATDPKPASASNASSDTPATAGAAYTAAIKVTGPTTSFHNSVAARYNYAFGKESPFLPSNATSVNGQFLSPKAFYTAEYCGHCHKEAFHQWRQSVHANSFRAPWYLKSVNMLIDERGVQYSRHCEGCHNPVALLSGDLTQGMPKKRPFEDEGVTCSTCHSIQSTDATGTGSYVMGIPAVMVDENGAPITRSVTDAEILAHLDRHSKAVMKPLYKTTEFCAACHKAAIPATLDSYKWLRAISLYDEWQAASFTKQSPLPFYRKDSVSNCQTCHMNRETLPAGSDDPGAKEGKFASHRWLGANTLMSQYYKYDEQAQKTADFLKNSYDGKGVFNVDIFALEKESAAATDTNNVLVAPLGLTHYAIAAGEALTADVVIQNKGIAHSHVPEQRDFYESWVNFVVKDGSGKTIAESGFLQPDGNLDPSAHSFTNRLINAKGELNDLHQIWHNRVLAYNNTIQSGRSQLVRYRFRLPKDITGQFTITATVKYRRFNQHYIDYAMGQQHYSQPIIEMASQTRTLTVGDNEPSKPIQGENPEWMRWNNYGITLLDAQQYAASVHAFERVATLRPDYADAFTNMGLVQISWERYNDAKGNLAKALTLLPGDPRALYYRALVERNAGQINDAIVDLEAVLVKYPRARDALRELGFSYYQQHDYVKSRETYERLQAVDPDDLAAHYQLAILYRRLGDKEHAAIESAKFADQKDDPTASAYALQFLSKHPEVAAESVVWHTHDLTGDPIKKPAKIEYTYIPGAGR
ncbi:multiheme c-type cytochrome [Terracidiphilus gabretensis]|jgi:tetratricopeptide (TPR) repeat protein/thiol-disulfide isomerase/thioredoxin|uniref:multiheme c-type cytochrome n=1 Tax=Terracidiphilus gabretensis TaxID=1577687 RepID=UPI001E634501|nr:multiheme c-type cytochrome [Terracidiphilus gabretensis]